MVKTSSLHISKRSVKPKYHDERSSHTDGVNRLRSLLSVLRGELYDYSPSSSESAVAVARQYIRADKRMALGDDSLKEKAIRNFKEVNAMAGSSIISLSSEIIAEASDYIRSYLEIFTKSYVSDAIQCPLDLGLLLSLWRYGPGASVGTKSTHFCDKVIVDKPSCTAKALPYAKLLRRLNPHLYSFDGNSDCEFNIVEGSNLTTVHKNADTDRTICTEPLMNMALQLAAGAYIEGAISRSGGDITVQEGINKMLAHHGSVHNDLCTIDLKNASDLITPQLIELLWPAEWYHLLMTIRSPSTTVGGDTVSLNMISTMGNGFTFPVMTMTLRAIVYAVQRCKHRTKHLQLDSFSVGVYGDDIIAPSKDYDDICLALSSAGLSVNTSKSFTDGPFRESCGGDYYNGKDVTPFYVESLRSHAEIYVAINKVLKWSVTHTLLPKTLHFLINLLGRPPLLVPMWDEPTSGILALSVKRYYKKLIPVKHGKSRTIRDDGADLLCILGGYCRSSGMNGNTMTYFRRPKGPIRYRIVKVSRPVGWRTGFHPDYLDETKAELLDLFLSNLINGG